jgi:hypothetical protein
MLNTMTETLRWKAFKNGSKMYIEKFVETTPQNHHYHLNTPIQRVIRQQGTDKALLVFTDGSVESFDHVVLAVHAHQALEILGEQSTSLERKVLGAFRTSRNECVVHSDPTVRKPSSILFAFFHWTKQFLVLFISFFPNLPRLMHPGLALYAKVALLTKASWTRNWEHWILFQKTQRPATMTSKLMTDPYLFSLT